VSLFLGALVGAVGAGALAWAAYVVASRAAGEGAPPAERACAAAIVASWLLVAAFLLLAPLHAFRLAVAAPLFVAAALAAHRALGRGGDAARRARADMGAARAFLAAALTGRRLWIALPAALLAAAKVSRGLIAPPLGWDALTYHLVKAGLWVQAGGDATFRGPDAWAYYRYFAPYGDVFWAWAMLPVRGDALLAPAGFAVWLAGAAGAYAGARALGARRTGASLAALAIAFTPAVFNAMTNAYVDNTVLALFLLGAPFAIRFVAAPRPADAALASAAFALAAGTKANALPLLALWGAIVVARLARGGVAPRMRRAALAGAALCGAVALPPYVEAWIHTGSPLYPLPVSIGGVHLLAGNPQLADLESGALLPDERFSVGEVLDAIVFSKVASGRQHIGFGPGFLVLLALGVLGARRLWKSAPTAGAAFLVLGAAASFLAPFASPASQALWSAWTYSSPRLATPALAGLALLGATLGGRGASLAMTAAVCCSLALCVPLGWAPLDLKGLERLLPVLGPPIAAAPAVGFWLRTRRWPAHRAAAVVLGAAILIAAAVVTAVDRIRGTLRHDYYAAAAEGRVHDFTTLPSAYVGAWPIWTRLDGEDSRRIAVTAGWDGMGHNWFVYPLLGRRLQNAVEYVPITRDGSLVETRDVDRLLALARPAAWTSLLIERRIGVIVTLAPPALEGEWMRRYPSVFEPIEGATGTGAAEGGSRAYRFSASAARELLGPTR
jgi:hypothetical protein